MNPVTVSSSAGGTAPITISLGNNQSGLHLQGTVTENAVNGRVTFNDLVLFGGSGENSKNLVLNASSGTDSATSSAFVVKPGADHFFIAPLSTAVAGNDLGPVTVQVLDANGTLTDSDSTTQVQLYTDHNPGGARFIDANGKPITGPITATVNQGVATFPDVRLDKAGVGYTLGVQPVNNPFLPQATSNTFAVSAARPDHLAFVNQPTHTGATDTINVYGGNVGFHTWTGVTAQVVDPFGNAVAGQVATTTTPSAAVGATDTSLTVASATGFPTAGPFNVQLDGEQMTVTAVAGNTWTVTRGVNSNPGISPTIATAPVTAGATTLTVNSAATFPTSVPFNIEIDAGLPTDEVMTVTGGAGTTTWTVTRGANAKAHAANALVQGTTKATHAAGAAVQLLSLGAATVAAFDARGQPVSFAPGSTTTVPIDSTGVATFTNLKIGTQANGYKFKVTGSAQLNGPPVALAAATSDPFNVGPVRGKLVFDPSGLVTTTTLSAAVGPNDTSLTVAGATGFPTTAPFNIQIDNEQMTVTAGAGTTTWTVARGIGATPGWAGSRPEERRQAVRPPPRPAAKLRTPSFGKVRERASRKVR
jgi:hypothetical protein